MSFISSSSSSSTLLFVTGASRGLGQAISVAFSRALKARDNAGTAVLMARSCMDETKELMLQENDAMKINPHRVDLSNLKNLESNVDSILERHRPTRNTHAVLINCAGTTGKVGPTSGLKLSEIEQATNLNLVSKMWLSSRFAQCYSDVCTTTCIANISSMCSIKPTPTMALYCAVSAGRDIFHQVLAQDHGNVRVINYAPGSCDTDMQAFLRSHDSLDTNVQSYCHSLEKDQKLVDPSETANELVRRILDNDMESGGRVEFTDVSTYRY